MADRGAPKSFGDFDVVREVGRGGMGVVYEVEHRSRGTRHALKVLSVSRENNA